MRPLPPLLALFLPALVGLLLLPHAASAQGSLSIGPESRLWVEGTSTRSDWTVQAKSVEGGVTLADAGSGSSVSGVQLNVDAAEIVSEKSSIMDRLIRGALKVEEHPTISYELVDATPADAEGDGFALQTSGRLTLAGVTNSVEMLVQGVDLGGGTFRYTGSTPLKMTDFDMTPPTAMFGALRTADDVTVHFEIIATPAD